MKCIICGGELDSSFHIHDPICFDCAIDDEEFEFILDNISYEDDD